jgi:hypothetical protein
MVFYYLFCFLLNKIGEQVGRTGSTQKQGKGGMEKVAQIMYTHVSKCKNDKIKKSPSSISPLRLQTNS